MRPKGLLQERQLSSLAAGIATATFLLIMVMMGVIVGTALDAWLR